MGGGRGGCLGVGGGGQGGGGVGGAGENGAVGGGGGGVGKSSEIRLFFRLIWNAILLFWNLRSSRLFHSIGKVKNGRFFRDSKLIRGR